MTSDLLSPLGPLFGPNFITITQNDETGREFQLEVYPDANNHMLRANGMPTHYYFVPQRVFLAKKQTSPADFDFGMTLFKGLLTGETTIGITDDVTTGGAVETGGSFCTFATTFAVPDSVIRGATKKLKQLDGIRPDEPNPELGIVTIVENNATIEVPDLIKVGPAKMPMFISAQGAGKGSIEATGISAFLVTCNELAAGAIVGSLKKGMSPFTVHYNLKQQFYINACQVEVKVDVDKVFEQFSVALSAGGFLGLDSISLSHAYQSTVTSGGISTKITMNNAVVDDALKKMIESQVEDIRKFALDMVKHEIFDFNPKPDTPATADRGFFSSIFGGSNVSMKSNYQKRSVHFTQTLEINGTIAVYDTKSGDLNDLEPAIKANLDKYLAVVDIGEYFKKLQVAATTNVNWDEALPDGTKLNDPITSIQLEVGYPDFSNSFGENKKPNPQFRGEGFHYVTGHKDQNRPSELILWNNKENGKEIVNIAFMKMQDPVPGWDVDEVILRKTIVYDPGDPRVELSNGGSTFTKEVRTKSHAPVITPDEVGYTFVKFMLSQRIPNAAISVTLVCKIGERTDRFNITAENEKNIIWEIFSDKYFNETAFTYELEVQVVGPDFTDPPVAYETKEPIKIDLPTGRIKYVNPVKLLLPPPPVDKIATINDYIKRFSSLIIEKNNI
ncbi:hypothetical protein Nit79A3_3029 [Nitrosomonas sp. Is79A3]|uniref:hypothetical protein n=1 Tax=Nitrosomonas sp. (strain Is79A3) TaxID=261292 RepID=UPI000215CA3F